MSKSFPSQSAKYFQNVRNTYPQHPCHQFRGSFPKSASVMSLQLDSSYFKHDPPTSSAGIPGKLAGSAPPQVLRAPAESESKLQPCPQMMYRYTEVSEAWN